MFMSIQRLREQIWIEYNIYLSRIPTGTLDIECVVAHDEGWLENNPHRFFSHK